MIKEPPDAGRASSPAVPENAPPGWTEIQQSLARDSGLAVLLVEGQQPPALLVSNNNSICQAIQSSPDHVALCDPYCGTAHRRARDANGPISYQCHAGLHCFATPVQIGRKGGLAVIGGRAFLGAADYRKTVERFRTGDLRQLQHNDPFTNILFSVPQDLEGLANRLGRAVRDYNSNALPEVPVRKQSAEASRPSAAPELQEEIERLRAELEDQAKFAGSLQYFLERISSTNPEETYLAILSNSKKLLQAERASLLVFDEGTNTLTVKAAVGLPDQLSEIAPIQLGEGISGQVLQRGEPLIVADMDAVGLRAAPRERLYKTRSLISYPLVIRGRKIGLLNLTDKSGGRSYDQVDLSLLELVAPQIALALERAGWQEKAGRFQLMSITDPLTSLPNRRYLEERLSEEVSRSKRYNHPMSFLMIDIDDFKIYNDLNGHQAGDLALQITAQALKGALRSADVASRYGGEEFCILLPQTSAPEASVLAERVRDRIEHTTYPHAKTQPLGAVTISIGVSTFSESVSTAEQIIWAADRALYEAKRLGKNKIGFYEEAPLRVLSGQ